MTAPNNTRSPMRVLIRPPPPPPPQTTVQPPPLPPLPPPPSLPLQQQQPGIVVVGFVGRRKEYLNQLINRVIDANVFGSGGADVALGFGYEEIKDWFKDKEVGYFFDEVKGVLYLEMCCNKYPVFDDGFDSGFEKQEFGELQGMLFMFSVCHVVIFMQEGSHFDIQVLKKFRVLQGSGSLLVLSRPTTKPEGGFKKKLQSSLEAQIRFSIKKCRVLSGSESGRNGPISNPTPLFSLDASKAVVILDRTSNQKGESLDFATSIVENVLNGEFIHRQCDILRGRGSTVSTGGVGMVAVAAAAAAASVAPGKPSAAPELPTLDGWLTSSQTILHGLLCTKPGLILEPEPEQNKRRPRQRNNMSPTTTDPLELASIYLDNSKGLNTKFSVLWCQRSLPVAKDIYLNGLPTCYPTSLHEAHLIKALTSFKSMVKGPAVEHYLKKLEDDCTSIWVSGRQLCDAVSLTGKSCIHQRHELTSKPHSSGLVFLHACACGRSRKLRADPFDFETANVTFNCYPECDKLLPTVSLPESKVAGPVQSSSWSLIRIGGSRYYQPAKGLLQSGFSSTDKFLLKWNFCIEKPKEVKILSQSNGSRVEAVSDANVKKTGNGVEIHNKVDSPVKVLPNFTMKKPFSEVVAGSAATNSGFPPLQLKKNVTLVQRHDTNDSQESKKAENITSLNETVDVNGNENGSPFLPVGKEHNVNQVVVYIGFEHECPCGHRFILTPDHLKGLGPIFAVDEFIENPDRKGDILRMGKHGSHGRVDRNSNKMARNPGRSREVMGNGNKGSRRELNGALKSDYSKDIEGSLEAMILDDDGNGVFPLLNRNLPLYLNCPHCNIQKSKNEPPNSQFAGTISQLQRIFLVTPSFPVVLSTCPVIQFEPFVIVIRLRLFIRDNATYSASADDIAVQSCFFDIQLTNLSPRNYIPPEVLLRVSMHPA
nr:putative smg8/Smg9 [Tanacetum cinerariifolium]